MKTTPADLEHLAAFRRGMAAVKSRIPPEYVASEWQFSAAIQRESGLTDDAIRRLLVLGWIESTYGPNVKETGTAPAAVDLAA